jgi:hypothetical protein
MADRNVIGDFSIMFRRRSEFLYRSLTDCDCQAIRRHNFYEVIEKYKELGMRLKAKAFSRYRDLIRKPVLGHKHKTYDAIYRLHPNERAKGEHVVDTTTEDEIQIINELGETAPEGDP